MYKSDYQLTTPTTSACMQADQSNLQGWAAWRRIVSEPWGQQGRWHRSPCAADLWACGMRGTALPPSLPVPPFPLHAQHGLLTEWALVLNDQSTMKVVPGSNTRWSFNHKQESSSLVISHITWLSQWTLKISIRCPKHRLQCICWNFCFGQGGVRGDHAYLTWGGGGRGLHCWSRVSTPVGVLELNWQKSAPLWGSRGWIGKSQHLWGGAELAKVSTSVGVQRLNWQKSAPLLGSRGWIGKSQHLCGGPEAELAVSTSVGVQRLNWQSKTAPLRGSREHVSNLTVKGQYPCAGSSGLYWQSQVTTVNSHRACCASTGQSECSCGDEVSECTTTCSNFQSSETRPPPPPPCHGQTYPWPDKQTLLTARLTQCFMQVKNRVPFDLITLALIIMMKVFIKHKNLVRRDYSKRTHTHTQAATHTSIPTTQSLIYTT